MKKWIQLALILLGCSSLLAQQPIKRSVSQTPAPEDQSRNGQSSSTDRDLSLLSITVAEQSAVIAGVQRLGVNMETALFNTAQTRQFSIPPDAEFVVISNHTAITEVSPVVAVLDFSTGRRQVVLGDVIFRAPERTRLIADRAAGQTFLLIFVKRITSAGKNMPRTATANLKSPLVPIALSPQCNNNGVLVSGVCLCLSGFAGSACSTCAPNHYNYPTCTYCLASTTCKGHGTCSSTGTCQCAPGYTGADCSCK